MSIESSDTYKREAPKTSLTVYLIKEGLTEPAAILETEGTTSHEIPINRGVTGHLFVKQTHPHPPRWAKFFSRKLKPGAIGDVATAGGVLLVQSAGRLFALTFGHGRHLLRADTWQERFGLRVALNCFEEGKLRSLDRQSFEGVTRHTREQTNRESTIEHFGLSVDQDLLRGVTGIPDDEFFGGRMSGSDSLTLSIAVTLEELPTLLERLLSKYNETSYLKNFEWVDQIAEIKSTSLVNDLDQKLARRISTGNLDRIWMAVPEVIDQTDIAYFRFGRRSTDTMHTDIDFPKFLKTVDDSSEVSIELLKGRKVLGVDGDGTPRKTWSAYSCVYAEIDRTNETYLLSAGKWYRIDSNFVDLVKKDFTKIPRYQLGFPPYDDESEGAYNKRVAQSDPQRFALMDQKFIRVDKSRSKVECCDLFANRSELVHVKKYGASSVLSHLFAQGLTSAQLFKTVPSFRAQVNEHLPGEHRIANVDAHPSDGSYHVVYAIISKAAGDLEIPFFSKLNLRNAHRTLSAFGFRVSIAKIEVERRRAVLEKVVTSDRRLKSEPTEIAARELRKNSKVSSKQKLPA